VASKSKVDELFNAMSDEVFNLLNLPIISDPVKQLTISEIINDS